MNNLVIGGISNSFNIWPWILIGVGIVALVVFLLKKSKKD